MKISTTAALLGIIALTGAGCAPSPTVQAPEETAPTKRIAEPTFVPTEAQIPANFPKDFPRYPGSIVFSALSDESHSILSLSTEDDAVAVMAWHRREFVEKGYAPGEKGAQGNAATETFIKDGIKFYVNTIDQGTAKPKTLFSLRREPIRTE